MFQVILNVMYFLCKFIRDGRIGFAQVPAVVPGVSRSGITMSAGRAMGMSRESIAKFTFLLSTPIILGDALYHAKDLAHVNIDVLPFAVAVATAAVVGLLSSKDQKLFRFLCLSLCL